MSARKASYMICERWSDPRVPSVGGAKILHLNEACAALYHRKARDMVGTDISLYQDVHFREIGRRNYTLAKHRQPAYKQAATVVRAPNGEHLGQVRRLVWREMIGEHGREAYMVRVYPINEMGTPHLPDLEAYGIDEETHHATCGRYTVQQLYDFHHNGTLGLRIGENLSTIIDKCTVIAKHFFCEDDGIALAFNRSRCNWSARDTSSTVQLAASCTRCGWQWWLRNIATTENETRCPMDGCQKRMPVAEAVGATYSEREVAGLANSAGNFAMEGA